TSSVTPGVTIRHVVPAGMSSSATETHTRSAVLCTIVRRAPTIAGLLLDTTSRVAPAASHSFGDHAAPGAPISTVVLSALTVQGGATSGQAPGATISSPKRRPRGRAGTAPS